MKNFIKQITPPVIKNVIKTIITKILKIKGKLKIDDYIITTPPEYPRKTQQKNNKLYDRFLPFLVKNITSNGLIVDIGANIGDTAISLVQNCNNEILCIEPSSFFYSYLEKNIELLNKNHKDRITLKKCFIGTGIYSGELLHIPGTASLSLSESTQNNFNTLDSVLSNYPSISIIKVDIDGYDFDALNSAKNTISNLKPVLFFENQIDHDFQMKGFSNTYTWLLEDGYNNICIFDNFGNIISISNNFDTLIDINLYLYSQLKYNCSRTFYYTDVLAFTDIQKNEIFKAILDYKKELIESN